MMQQPSFVLPAVTFIMPGPRVRPKTGPRTGSGPASTPLLAAPRQGVDAGAEPRHDVEGGRLCQCLAGFIACLMAIIVIATAPLAHADANATSVGMRAGTHPGFGRLVFDFDQRAPVRQAREGDRLTLRFAPGTTITPPPHMPHNVQAMDISANQVVVTLAADATARVYWLGALLVVDVFDPAGAATASAAAVPPATHYPPARPIPDAIPPPVTKPVAQQKQAVPPPAPVSPQLVATPSSVPAPPSPPPPAPPASGPVALVATPSAPVVRAGAALSIPFAATTSAAAFRRGNAGVVVFDEPRPIDLAAVHDDPAFGAATVQVLPHATVLLIPLPPDKSLALTKSPQAWRVGIVDAMVPGQPIALQVANDTATLPLDGAGDVVTIADPETGTSLLVGTQHLPGQAVPALHRTPDFNLLPTWQGIAIDPLSDALVVRASPSGLALSGGRAGLATSSSTPELRAQAEASGLTRRFDLRALAPEVLLQRLTAQVDAAATAPPLARGGPRRQAAVTMLALGMGPEAEAMLQLAAADDPAGAAAPDAVGLMAVAALLAGRPTEADGITDPRLTGSDEVTLWRAVRDAMRTPGSAQAASGFVATLPLIDIYPVALRQRLLPLAFETIIEGGQVMDAARLLSSHADDPGLALARAMLRATNGDTDGALAAYEALAAGADRRSHAIAAVRAVELRLAAGRINTEQAADALDRLLYAWRGGKRELALRERVAELRQRSGAWRTALALLRETADLFPDDKDGIQTRMKETFAALLRDNALEHMPPLELVAMIEENTDLLPGGTAGEALDERLADRLVTLDLPQKAAPVLEKLMQAAPSPVGRAGFGTRLAAVRLREDDPKGALATLAASDSPDLPAPMAESRALLQASARARSGDPAGAVAGLAALDTAATEAARATILEQAKDWPGAERALHDYVARMIPEADILAPAPLTEEQQRMLVRYATAAAQAGDDTALGDLRTRFGPRMPRGAFGDMFRLLTAAPVQGVLDLPRAGRESLLAHDLPKTLGALAAPSATQ